MGTPSTPLMHIYRRWLLFGLGVCGLVAAIVLWPEVKFDPGHDSETGPMLSPDPPPPDPRRTIATPFRNVRPEVAYVGDAACTDCHAAIAQRYQAHPMGRSATTDLTRASVERYDPAARNPFAHQQFELGVELRPPQVFHFVRWNAAGRDAARGGDPRAGPNVLLLDYRLPVHVAIGSGTRGRSYLSWEQGALWQSPVSWFSLAGHWDISPGFDLGEGGRRPITPECLFCHVQWVEPVGGAVNRYREPLFPHRQAAIGCERCHGPGALHVEQRGRAVPVDGPFDPTIVNPRHLSVELQVAVCQQCHLQGQVRVVRRGRSVWEYRPGLPWDAFVTVFVRHPHLTEWHRSVGQFEQMEQSRCYLASQGRMVCTTCHDPHYQPTAGQRDGHYRQSCLGCHTDRSCTAAAAERHARGDSCIRCHMPQVGSATIAHASVTDHRILRRPTPPAPPRPLPDNALPLVPYRRIAGHDAATNLPHELDRDWAIAIARLVSRMGDNIPPPQRLRYAEWAAARLDNALSLHCGDYEAWIAKSQADAVRGKWESAWQAAEYAAQLRPDSEIAWQRVAETALTLPRPLRADEATSRLVQLNPRSVEHILLRIACLVQQRNWGDAEHWCRQGLMIHPLHPQLRLYLAVASYHLGDAATARQQLDWALQLATQPQQRTTLRQWYRRLTAELSPK